MYNCSYTPRAKADTVVRDSINVDEEIMLDEDGMQIEKQPADETSKEGNEPTQKKENKKPKEQVVNFDDL